MGFVRNCAFWNYLAHRSITEDVLEGGSHSITLTPALPLTLCQSGLHHHTHLDGWRRSSRSRR